MDSLQAPQATPLPWRQAMIPACVDFRHTVHSYSTLSLQWPPIEMCSVCLCAFQQQLCWFDTGWNMNATGRHLQTLQPTGQIGSQGEERNVVRESWPLPWEIWGLSKQRETLWSVWYIPRWGRLQCRESKLEIGGCGMWVYGGLLVVCVSVMNVLCNGNKLNFKPWFLKERNLLPLPRLHQHLL